MTRIRYAQVGLGIRSWLFSVGVVNRFSDDCELVGLCDANAGRLQQRVDWAAANGLAIPGYTASDFERMLEETRPDVVIVTTPDVDHADRICRAMELGCDVVTEKPMTIDAGGCGRILETQARTGRSCRVAFNYRYSPPREQVKSLLQAGAIGEVLSVDFHWHLDTTHGADYFRRWHRRKESSGGLLVHKATHHFDLVNWWLDSVPDRVQASGHRRYYTPERAEALGLSDRAERCLDCPASGRCPFHLDLRKDKILGAFYRDHEHHDGYYRDQCVFSGDIDIEDCMNLLVDYTSGARMAYSLNAFLPCEGYRVAFNGTQGRLEHVCVERSYVSGSSPIPGTSVEEETSIRVTPLFDRPQDLEVWTAGGGHGGGDERLLEDILPRHRPADPLGRAADQRAGAWSILTGIAANRALDTGQPVRVADLLPGSPPLPDSPPSPDAPPSPNAKRRELDR